VSEEETRDTRSYSERYAPAPEPPPPPPPPGSSGSMATPFLAIIGVGLLAAAIVAALVLRGGSTAPLATTPTSVPSTAAASVGPAATPDADDLAINRFWVLIADPKLSYHLETKGGGTIGSEAYTFSESLDVSGDSWAGTERAHGLGGGGVTSIVTLDTEVWFKFPDGWHKNIEHDPYFRSRPFLDLGTQRDLIVSATVEKAGKTLYDLKSTTNYLPYPGRLIGFFSMGIRVDTLELDILVTADGVPVEATVHILAGGLGSNGKPQLDAKSTRTFTKFGATFTIKAPKP
jgi:hypothetical protein